MSGQCVLDCGALTACDRACVDLLTDAAHCGTCNAACTGGETCDRGTCVCPVGLQACGGTCVDIALDPEHCGGCDQSCGSAGLCEGGLCKGPDGCSDTPVTGLALSAVDAYQTVQIPIVEGGSAIARQERNADVVVGRKTMFRIHVTPEAGWMPRMISARIELTAVEAPEPEQRELFFAQLTPIAASSDADAETTFQIVVPAESIGPLTRYAVTLVECEERAASMTAASARFPADGYAPLEARETGPLKVHILPMGIPAPDTSEEGLRAFEERLEAAFPITEVLFTVGEPLQTSATSMCSALASVASRHSQDNPAEDVYYYGLTPGILGRESGCSYANPSAASAKTSIGWAQGFEPDDGTTGAATMCHELGHAHGRQHAPCRVSDPDGQYPYPNADIGVWGYDARTDELYEPTRKDLMSYCPEPRDRAWISDYTYQGILERMIEVSALAERPAPLAKRDAATPWQMLVSDSQGVHWIEEPLFVRGTPDGERRQAIVHGTHGPMLQIEVYVQRLDEGGSAEAFILVLPQTEADWTAIEVPRLLALRAF